LIIVLLEEYNIPLKGYLEVMSSALLWQNLHQHYN